MPQPPAPLCVARRLRFGWPGRPLFDTLSFAIKPGLTLIHGGESCGKTTLLRLLGGEIVPTGGSLLREAGAAFHADLGDPALNATTARNWLVQQQQRWSAWDAAAAAAAIDALALAPHLDKTFAMLSTGSRRKPGLVAAAASGAALTLLDQPYAALDAPSCRWLDRRLHHAAAERSRAWVLADYVLPAGLAGAALAAEIDLGEGS
jgi:ATPase subunit of ABC transporter with duplicated ATPase domains